MSEDASAYEPHRCDFCNGTVRPEVARSEPIRACGKLVLLDGLVIGKCDRCGHRYYPAAVVKRAEQAAKDPGQAARIESVPVVAA